MHTIQVFVKPIQEEGQKLLGVLLLEAIESWSILCYRPLQKKFKKKNGVRIFKHKKKKTFGFDAHNFRDVNNPPWVLKVQRSSGCRSRVPVPNHHSIWPCDHAFLLDWFCQGKTAHWSRGMTDDCDPYKSFLLFIFPSSINVHHISGILEFLGQKRSIVHC